MGGGALLCTPSRTRQAGLAGWWKGEEAKAKGFKMWVRLESVTGVRWGRAGGEGDRRRGERQRWGGGPLVKRGAQLGSGAGARKSGRGWREGQGHTGRNGGALLAGSRADCQSPPPARPPPPPAPARGRGGARCGRGRARDILLPGEGGGD